jgi:hypothetical protein
MRKTPAQLEKEKEDAAIKRVEKEKRGESDASYSDTDSDSGTGSSDCSDDSNHSGYSRFSDISASHHSGVLIEDKNSYSEYKWYRRGREETNCTIRVSNQVSEKRRTHGT